MSLEVVAASTDRYLTTTAAVKALVLGATATSTVEDAYLSDLILRASAWAERYVGYKLSAEKVLERLPAFGTGRVVLSR